MIWIFKENSLEAFENNVRVTTPLALKVPLALRRGVRGEAKGLGGEASHSVLMPSIGFFWAMRWVCR